MQNLGSFDLYSNKLSAIRLRNIYTSKIKEIEISNKRELNPIPYNITLERLRKFDTFYFTEGHIDALSLGVENFVAVEGVNSFNFDNLTLFKDKQIILAFDNDKAGQNAIKKFIHHTRQLNIHTSILTWDDKRIKDINELLIQGKLHTAYIVDAI